MPDRISATSQRSERGAIIIIVLLVLAVLSFISMELSKETLIDRAGVAYVKSTLVGTSLCDSGMMLAKKVLLEDAIESESDNLHEDWANFNATLVSVSEELTSGSIGGFIADENSRFPINKIRELSSKNESEIKQYRALFLRLLINLCKDLDIEADPSIYIDSIRFWMGEQVDSAKFDDDWYMSRKPQYLRTYSSLRSPEELLFIRWDGAKEGDVKKLYYGTEDVKGLRDLITVWGEGPINMNTVCPEVARAIPLNENQQNDFEEAVVEYQSAPENYFTDTWYLEVLRYLGMKEAEIPKNCMTVKSSTFAIQLKASIGSGVRKERIVVNRTSKTLVPIFSYAN